MRIISYTINFMSPKDSIFHSSFTGETGDRKPVIDMTDFRAEIAVLVAREKEKYSGMIELKDVDPKDLTDLDASMWYKVNHYTTGLITEAQLKEYREDINRSNEAVSRQNFQAVISNKLTNLWGNEQLEKIRAGI